MYVELLTRTLTNTIYQDRSISMWASLFRLPFRKVAFKEDARRDGKDWPSLAHTMVGMARLKNLADLTHRVLQENVAGDLIETGVWRGGCCILMRGVLRAYNDENRKVFLADSFEGLPPPSSKFRQDRLDLHHWFKPVLAVSEEQVRENFRRYDLLDEKVVFIKGFFKDTLHKLDGPFSLIRLDGDMYESTMDALKALYPKLSPGGFVVIDDYGLLANCRQAVDDYRESHDIEAPITKIDHSGVWWRKPAHGAAKQQGYGPAKTAG